jgi:hypothetical protein
LFGQLDEKGKGFYRAAMEADNPKDYAKNLIKLTNRKYKNVDSTDMGAILTKLNAEQFMGIQTPNAGVVGTSGLNAVGQKTELMGEIASSGYAELFQTPLARQYMSQLADPDSELAQRAKTPGGKAAVANMITEQLARVSQENGVTMTAEGKADVRSIAIRAAGGDEEMRKQMAIEINRGQDDVKSKLDTSNIYLQSLDQNMAKTSKISDASGGYALRVVVYENSTAGYGGAKKHHESMASVKP